MSEDGNRNSIPNSELNNFEKQKDLKSSSEDSEGRTRLDTIFKEESAAGVSSDGAKEPDPLVKCDDFDDIVNLIGSHGKYQQFLLYVVLSPIIACQPLFTLNAIFMLFIPDHWCKVEGVGRNESNLEFWKNSTIPREIGPDGKERYSQCSMYGPNETLVQCTNGWDFDKKDFDSTLPSNYMWVCNKAHYSTDALTLYALGNAVGTIILGRCADKFGRKPIFFISCFIIIFFRAASLYIPDYFSAFLAAQFLTGTAFPIMYIAPSMIVAEISDNEYRAWLYSWTWVVWVLGMASLPLIAWLCSSWYIIGLLTSLPGVLLFVYWWILPESPRWLVSVGRIEESKKVIQYIAKFNGTEDKLTPNLLESMLKRLSIKNQEINKKKIGIWTLFTKLRLAKNTILICISWSMNALVYYGITLNANQMSGNQFINFFLLAIIEIPSGFLGGYLAEKFGRRWTQVAFFKLCFLTCLIAGLGATHSNLFYLVIIAVIIAKFSITLTFLIVYLQGTEVFPTLLRSTGSGFASTVASIVSALGPYIIYLGKYDLGLPYYALAGLSLIGVVASAFLPETLGQKLPETIEEANEFGNNEKFWSLRPTPKESKGIPNTIMHETKIQ